MSATSNSSAVEVSRVASNDFSHISLADGAQLIVAPMRERASVTIALMFGVGSRHESAAQSGLAHFLEHVVFKGSRQFPTAQAISAAIEGVGGVLNAATDKEMTMFWAKVPAAAAELAYKVLQDMLFAPMLDETELLKEQSVVIEELRMYLDNPQDYVQTLFDEVMWPDHALGRDTAGSEATVRTFGRELCRAHLSNHYRAENMVMAFTGAVSENDARQILARQPRDVPHSTPRKSPNEFAKAPLVPQTSTLRLVNKKAEQANLVIGAYGLSYLDEDRFALDVLNTILGDGMSSRLFVELRERRALAYDVHSFTSRYRDCGTVGIYIGCEPKRAVSAMRAAIDELERFATTEVTATELTRAHEYTKGRLLVELESTSSLANYLGQQQLLTGEVLPPEEVIARTEAVTAKDVLRVAQTMLAQPLRAAIVGPFRNEAKFADLLHV